jgi:hypothetical protein
MIRSYVATPLLVAILLFAGHSYGQDQAAISSIVDVLRKGQLSGSLLYRGQCGKQDEYVTRSFPITTSLTTHSGPSLQILREIFAKDADIQVTQEPDGFIRIVDTTAPHDLLSVKIKSLSFDDEQTARYNPVDALTLITSALEVEAFMKEHGIGWQGGIINEAFSPGKPYLSGKLNNVTLSQALDYMAKSFHGLWVYKECPGNQKNKRVIDIWFYRTGLNESYQ